MADPTSGGMYIPDPRASSRWDDNNQSTYGLVPVAIFARRRVLHGSIKTDLKVALD